MDYVEFVNRKNLQVARENIGLDTLSASKKVTSSKKDVVLSWENGEQLPTWPQLKKLSKLYGISELLLLSKKVIEKQKSIPDYRIGSDAKENVDVNKLISLVIRRQSWLEKKLKTNGVAKNKLIGSGKDITNPHQLANFIAKSLELNLSIPRAAYGVGARKKLLKYLIQKAEDKGIFVGKTISYHKIPISDMRGLFIANDYCPYIVINKKDAFSAQIFSFIHELAHLFRRTESISNSLDLRSSNHELDPEEVFCNKVAAELLLPQGDFTQAFYSKSDIDALSERYKVSKIFIFYRLKDLGLIPRDQIDSLEKEIKREVQQALEHRALEEGESGGNYINNMKDSNGRLFNRIVSNSYYDEGISYVEASRLLCFSAEKV